MKKIGIALVAVLALTAACGGNDGGEAAPSGEGAAAQEAVALSASDMAFSPPTLEAPAGGSIEFVNDDDAKHSFTVEEAGIDTDADAGASATVDLGDAEPGSYDFVCKYHPDMKGTLEITG